MQISEPDTPAEFFPLSSGRTLGFSDLNSKNWPLASIVSKAWEASSGEDFDVFRKVFCAQWELLQSASNGKSVAEYLGLPRPTLIQSLLPHWTAVTPWESKSFLEMYFWLPGRVRKNRKVNGLEVPKYLMGSNLMRFDSENGANSHAVQYFSLLKSIEANGFTSTTNQADPLLVNLLRKGSETRWSIWSGTHRTVSATVLGLGGIFGKLKQEINRDDACYWPNVRNRSLSPYQATTFFDYLFEGHELPNNRNILTLLR